MNAEDDNAEAFFQCVMSKDSVWNEILNHDDDHISGGDVGDVVAVHDVHGMTSDVSMINTGFSRLENLSEGMVVGTKFIEAMQGSKYAYDFDEPELRNSIPDTFPVVSKSECSLSGIRSAPTLPLAREEGSLQGLHTGTQVGRSLSAIPLRSHIKRKQPETTMFCIGCHVVFENPSESSNDSSDRIFVCRNSLCNLNGVLQIVGKDAIDMTDVRLYRGKMQDVQHVQPIQPAQMQPGQRRFVKTGGYRCKVCGELKKNHTCKGNQNQKQNQRQQDDSGISSISTADNRAFNTAFNTENDSLPMPLASSNGFVGEKEEKEKKATALEANEAIELLDMLDNLESESDEKESTGSTERKGSFIGICNNRCERSAFCNKLARHRGNCNKLLLG